MIKASSRFMGHCIPQVFKICPSSGSKCQTLIQTYIFLKLSDSKIYVNYQLTKWHVYVSTKRGFPLVHSKAFQFQVFNYCENSKRPTFYISVHPRVANKIIYIYIYIHILFSEQEHLLYITSLQYVKPSGICLVVKSL